MLSAIVKLIRPTQWLKNSIVLAALIFAKELGDSQKVATAFSALGVFCLLSSAVYIFNDLIDRNNDKQHPIKKNRPLASGRISVGTAVGLMVFLLGVGLILAWLIMLEFLYLAMVFILFNILYTLILKNVVILDVMSIAFSFVIRAYAGAVVIDVPTSKWLLINTLLLSLFLSFGKRRHEIILLEDEATSHRKILGRYSPYLLDQMIGVVTASVVVMYMLYSFSPEVSEKLGTGNLFLTIPFVVYGIFRYLYLIHRKRKGGSPTRVLITDFPILLTVILWIITVVLLLYSII